jgi:hypothetical protein
MGQISILSDTKSQLLHSKEFQFESARKGIESEKKWRKRRHMFTSRVNIYMGERLQDIKKLHLSPEESD